MSKCSIDCGPHLAILLNYIGWSAVARGCGAKVGLMAAENNNGNDETVFAPEDITRTELSCLALVAEGWNVDAMSDKLALSRREIEVLLFCAQRKLGADNLLQAVSIAMSKRIIQI